MDAVTYPAIEVVEFVMEHLIPLKINLTEKPFYENSRVLWTPTILILDYDGSELQRTVGYLAPDEFIPMLHLGKAKLRLSHEEFDGAEVHFNRLLERYPESDAVPEALYFQGVNRYKMKNNPMELKEAYEKLLTSHPDNSWTKRAAPYQFM
ncbi:MAG: hypothetical protein VR65_09250 [Desulfobulbaceae bacterium BRH_c16a]|nr:MAG: hypothetical protein VR65_09250 [Desulfobulbaceae bacterium BRH_c16a]